MPVRRRAILLALCTVASSCALGGSSTPQATTSLAAASGPEGSAPLLEMELTNRAFVEWYLSLVGQAAEDLTAGNASSEQRREAAVFRFMQGTSAYAIAAGPNAYAQLIDLVALVTLEKIQWVDEGRASDVFGDRGVILETAITEAEDRVWNRAVTYMTPEETAHLREVIAAWREENPDLRALSFVRMTDFAHQLALSMEVFDANRGILGRIAETNREIDETRLLGERAMYLMERSPLLLGWRIDAIVSDLMTHPELDGAWSSLDAVAGTASDLEARLGRLEVLMAALPTDFVTAINEGTEFEASLLALAAVAPAFADLPAAAGGVEASLAHMVELADGMQATYSPEFMRAEADLAAARLVREAQKLILLAALCGAALMLLHFLLRRMGGRSPR